MAAVTGSEVLPDQRARAFIDGDAIGGVAVDLVARDDVVDAVAIDDDARQIVVVGLVVEDPAVVDFARDDDAVLELGAVSGVLGNDQAQRTVVRIDAVVDVVVVDVVFNICLLLE